MSARSPIRSPAAAMRHPPRWRHAVLAGVIALASSLHADPRAAVAAPPGDAASAPAVRIVTAGGTRMRIEVTGVSDAARVRMLHDWAEEAVRASVLPSGRFALREATTRISEIDSASASPVPWGQTLRRDGVSVLLYVRRSATLAQLRADWTAVHEFAHLRHPYLGEEGRWLAEGLASYLQNTLRAQAGLLAKDDAWRRLDAGFRRGEAVGEGAPIARVGRARGATMRVYWVGAAFWLDADLALRRTRGTTLDAVLDRYAQCCLDGEASLAPEAFLAELDRLAGGEAAGGDLFLPLYARYAPLRGFPSLEAQYRALGIVRDGAGVRFVATGDAARLRDAIMSRD